MSKTYKDLAESGLPVQSIISSHLSEKAKEFGFERVKEPFLRSEEKSQAYQGRMTTHIRAEFGLDNDFQINFKPNNSLTRGTRERIADAAISGTVEFRLGNEIVEKVQSNLKSIKMMRGFDRKPSFLKKPKKKYSDLSDEEAQSTLADELTSMIKEYPTPKEIAYYIEKRFGVEAEFQGGRG